MGRGEGGVEKNPFSGEVWIFSRILHDSRLEMKEASQKQYKEYFSFCKSLAV